MANIFSANKSSVLVDGQEVEGVRALAFRVVTEREDVGAVGSGERIGVIFGLSSVLAELTVSSADFALDKHLADRSVFQLVARLGRDAGAAEPARTLAFDECYLDGKSFSMGTGGLAVSVYSFSATRVREE